MNMHLDTALLFNRQAAIHNGAKPVPLGTTGDLSEWMRLNGRKPGDDCSDYPGFRK